MRIEAKIEHVPASENVSAEGIILELPVDRFHDPETPQLAFHRLLRQPLIYCEYGNPDLGKVTFDNVTDTIRRMKTIDMSRICGILTKPMVEVKPRDRVIVTATFTPTGPYKDAVINLMKVSGHLCLGARYLLNEDGKIHAVPTWDVVTEVPMREFSFGLTLKKNQ